ncbi:MULTISPECIES: PilZ domain-containing protein [Marinobacter]|uniref:PilZ domain-containing protein n=1 Tax=Marinobacter xiaoshiensis TaxID=3073652 RepID=A0ABU2HGF3_9GAMM|nr:MULTISPECIES: PilZ domain-containing protein [unclassified Marinobacter]MBK1871852.1 PilZ domain-containing protein [Marinobacter sp. 1-3A]MBK1885832.1 PilZ domain-containing protein [Marinobacter sp. DY40_1A1]MDS1309823.1 PilZ domain-containing protein [Marinobacter sp. F60267]
MHTEDTPYETTDNLPERREFFRIEDRIGLEVRKLSPSAEFNDNHFNDEHIETLKADFRRLDQDIKSQLASLADQDRLLTGLVKSLNGKLDTLARIMAFQQNPLQPGDWQDVTLSEGGLAFSGSPQAWQTGDKLAVRMTLPPELFQPRGVAQVLDVQATETGGARVHTGFIQIQDGDRQQIARHVMRWQIRQRQKE